MAISLQTFFNFTAKHALLLQDLCRLAKGIRDDDLHRLLARHLGPDDPSTSHVAEQLVKLGILQSEPGGDAQYELTRPVAGLLQYIVRQQRLTSAAVIKGYLGDLDSLCRELVSTARALDGDATLRAVSDADDLVERVRYDSASNREGIISEVLALKSGSQSRSARERFEIVNRLWIRYIEPLRELIEVDRAMDAATDDLDRSLEGAQQSFAADGVVTTELRRTRARLRRLRRDVSDDHTESVREILPLYETLRRETELVKGASRALELIRQGGVRSLHLDQRLPLPVWRREGLMADPALEAYLHEVHGYQPRQPPRLSEALPAPPPRLITREEVSDRIAAVLPVLDVLRWLTETFQDLPTGQLLKGYGWIHAGQFGRTETTDPVEREYSVGGATFVTRPLALLGPYGGR